MKRRAILPLVVLVLLTACRGGSNAKDMPADAGLAGPARDGSPEPGGDASQEHPRAFRLSTTGTQLLVAGEARGFQLTPANVIEDSDVVVVHQEFYGVPWEAFEADTAPPAEWVAVMKDLAMRAKDAKRPVFLSISMLNGSRDSLANRTIIKSGAVDSQDHWAAPCYDFATASDGAAKQLAYLRYLDFMLKTFEPVYLNLAIEVNLFFEKCSAATPALIDLINTAYDRAKARAPKTVVFPSFQIDHLYGYSEDSCPDQNARDTCFDALYAVIEPIKRDRFAMSSYPYLSGFTKASELPDDWFARGSARSKERGMIVETGWPSTDIVVRAKDGTCPTFFSFDETTSADYLSFVLRSADTHGLELVTWWSDRDLLVSELMTDCPCDFDMLWCPVLDGVRGSPSSGAIDSQAIAEVLFKIFGTMGLRDYDGTPKVKHMKLWKAARGRPLE